jgi:hypothetical protein
MRALDHKDITATMLHASSVAEPDTLCTHPWWVTTGEKEWAGGTAYVLNDYVIRSATHRVYRAIQSSTGRTPETNPLFWEDVGPTNRWAPFDMKSSTAMKGASPYTVTLRPGSRVTDLDLSGLDNVITARLQVWSSPGGTLVHDDTMSTLWWVGDLYVAYYFDLPQQRRRVKFTGIPTSDNPEMLLTLTASSAGSVFCSQIAAGRYVDLGCAEYGLEMRLRNFGKVEEDEWGNTKIRDGLVVRDLAGSDLVEALDANRVAEFALKNRNRAMVWEAVDEPMYDYLSTTGIANVSIRPEGPALARMTIEIQGVGA